MSNFGPNSVGSDLYTTSLQSPDSLPVQGYSIDQLRAFIQRSLGSPTWQIEITPQQIIDQILNALALYSQYVPQIKARAITLVRGQHAYLHGVSVGQGIADVQFVQFVPSIVDVFYLGMINPAPLPMAGISEFDSWLRFRSTFMRVTSARPDYYYDDSLATLFIHNPIVFYRAGVIIYDNYTDTKDLTSAGALWVKEFALESSRFLLGTLNQKFSGAIPSPLQNLQLDQNLRVNAEKALDRLRQQLFGLQRGAGISIDA